MSENLPEIMPGAGAQFHPGNTIGCLLIHGYMASPGEVGWMGAYLAEQGYTVSVPRLPGHGIDPTHMPRMRWQDWYAHILDMYDVLAAQCERVYVIGHSMGGMLATLLASQRQVAGLVIADTPFILNDARMQYAKPISVIKPYMDFPTGDDLQHTILTEQKKRGEALTGRVNYSKWATRAVHEIYTLANLSRETLPQVTCPTLLLYAKNSDTTINQDDKLAAGRLSSTHIETHIVEKGGHIIFQDAGRDEAFRVVAKFIAQQLSTT